MSILGQEEQKVFLDTWKKLDADGEKCIVDMEKMLTEFNNKIKKQQQQQLQIEDGLVLEYSNKPLKEVDLKNYKGPVVEFPLNEEGVRKMICVFQKGRESLHYNYVMSILLDVKLLSKKENLHHLKRCSIPNVEDGKVIVVGDLHGQLQDLLTILDKFGFPSEKQRYVFNGDFVDRGKKSLEVLLILYSLKLVYPESVFLNRGNHEFESLNIRYGFEEEVLSKYDKTIFRLIQDTFKALSLYTLLEEKVFILHGGLFQYANVSLDILKKLRVPVEANSGEMEKVLCLQSLWSDPDDEEGFAPSDRGVGILFGGDVTENFLQTNQLQLVVRSHEMVDEGYEFKHNNQLLTVFSASYYAGGGQNKGAVAIFERGKSLQQPTFFQYLADDLDVFCNNNNNKKSYDVIPVTVANISSSSSISSPSSSSSSSYLSTNHKNSSDHGNDNNNKMFETSQNFCKMDSLETLKEKIFVGRSELFREYSKMKNSCGEPDNGLVTVSQWIAIMHSCIPLTSLESWRTLQPYLSHVVQEDDDKKEKEKKEEEDDDGSDSHCKKKEGKINFLAFLNQFSIKAMENNKITSEYEKQIVSKLSKVLMENMSNLKEAFQKFDSDKDGKLSYQEFFNILKNYDLCMSNSQMFDFTTSIDEDKSGFIEFEEFQHRFHMQFESKISDEVVKKKLQMIAMKILEKKTELRAAFRDFDVNQDKKLQFTEFSQAIKSLLLQSNNNNNNNNQNNNKNNQEKKEQEQETIMDHFQKDILGEDESGQVTIIRQLFDSIDVDHKEHITWEEFEKAFSVSDAKSDRYTQEIIQNVCAAIYKNRYQLKHMFREMDLDGNGLLSFEEFKVALKTLNILSSSTTTTNTTQSRHHHNHNPHHHLTDEIIKVIFDAIDTDKSGNIDFQEFTQSLKLIVN